MLEWPDLVFAIFQVVFASLDMYNGKLQYHMESVEPYQKLQDRGISSSIIVLASLIICSSHKQSHAMCLELSIL